MRTVFLVFLIFFSLPFLCLAGKHFLADSSNRNQFLAVNSSGNQFLAVPSTGYHFLADTTTRPGGPRDKVQYGVASYYHSKFNGRKTASGDIYDEKKFTAAHNGLPLRTWVKITNLSNNRSVVVRINDRMHPKNKRLVDLSRAAASRLGYIGKGLVKVKLEVLGKKRPKLPN